MTGSGKSGFTLLPDKNSLSGVDRAPEQDYNPFVVICIAGLAAHGSFIFLFVFIGANHLAILNLFSIGIWLAAFLLSRKRRIASAVLLALFEVMGHAIIASISLGLSTGFHLYMWAAMLLVGTIPGIPLRYSSLLASLPLLLLVTLEMTLGDVPYAFKYPEYVRYMLLGNILITGASLLFAGFNIRREDNRQRQRLIELANHDDLTRLYNRRFGHQALEQSKRQAERNGQPFCVAMADIDYFKKLNDTFGHDAGDAVLRGVAECFRTRLRKSDTVCRWGGEEFLILISNSALDSATKLVESLRISIQDTEVKSTLPLPGITVSFGVAQFEPGEPIDKLIIRADNLLYQAKAEGRNRTVRQS